jgi:hypothetical protein
MDDILLKLLPVVLVPLFFIGLVVYSLKLQRKGVRVQGDAMSRVEESIEMQRESIQIQRHSIEIQEENLAVQHEIRGLLERLIAAEGRRS